MGVSLKPMLKRHLRSERFREHCRDGYEEIAETWKSIEQALLAASHISQRFVVLVSEDSTGS